MRRPFTLFWSMLLAALLCLPQVRVQAGETVFSEAELDQMMAPIALYPDSLLSQILMATTYPADVAEAVQWSKANPEQTGDAAVQAVQDKNWDPAVMSLVAFPQVLEMMGEQLDWVQNVGDAFLADADAVMDTVQKLRRKAREEGNLETTEQQKVIIEKESSSSETIIIIEPADPQVVYVPTYNPTVVYGSWWWPNYTPWHYYPPGYAFGAAVVRGIAFGIGVHITHSLWGGFHWGHGGGHGGHRGVNINVNKFNNININRNKLKVDGKNVNWKHNAKNRKGVPYRDARSRKQYGNRLAGAEQRSNFRGRDAKRDKARATLDRRAVSPAEGRKQLRGSGGDKVRDSVKRANRDIAQGKLGRIGDKSGSRDLGKARDGRQQFKGGQNTRDARTRDPNKGARDTRQGRDRSSASGAGKRLDRGGASQSRQKRRYSGSRNNALRGAGNAQRSRQFSRRGSASNRSLRSRGGARAGGGRGR